MPAPTALRAPEDVPLPEDEVEMLDPGIIISIVVSVAVLT